MVSHNAGIGMRTINILPGPALVKDVRESLQVASDVLKRQLLTRIYLIAFHKAGEEQCVLQVSIFLHA